VIHGSGIDAVLIVAGLAGAGCSGAACIVGAASTTPSASASATGGSSWSCVHSPLKAAVPGLRRCSVAKLNYLRFPKFRFCNSGPHWLRQARGMLAHKFSASATFLPRESFPAAQHPSFSTVHTELRVGREHNRGCNRYQSHLVKQTRIGEKYKCLRIGYPLSDPSRRRERPGTRKAYAGTRPMRTS
jgi:hypothetical protein